MSGGLWIIGYGNPDRRDDGCGWHVAARLRSSLGEGEGITIRSLHQLDPVLAEDLEEADEVLFVDASVEESESGVEWRKVLPEGSVLPPMTHHLKPSFLMRLILSLGGRCPEAWLVSVKGEDFGLGEGLSPSTEQRVERVSEEILSYVLSSRTTDRQSGEMVKELFQGKSNVE
jgi:hydrogenase maturation protease